MSLSIKTVHRSPIDVGAAHPSASSLNSPFMDMPILSACSSRNEPVPAAQTLFISKSTTTPFFNAIYFESWPPISNIVSTVGSMTAAAVAWAVISFRIISAPTKSPIRYLPEPVVPTPITSTLAPHSSPISSSPSLTASMGLPAVARYLLAISFFSLSISTTFVLTEPMSIPR